MDPVVPARDSARAPRTWTGAVVDENGPEALGNPLEGPSPRPIAVAVALVFVGPSNP